MEQRKHPVENMVKDFDFWLGKKVLITGHTGFKGVWLSLYLKHLGADICGVSLSPPSSPSLFDLVNLDTEIQSENCDIRNRNSLIKIFKDFNPEVVFHLAAQSLVGMSYSDPVDTYDINVMGTLNILEAIRHTRTVKSAVMITSDKCYENKEWIWGYRENDELGGHDPYSSSKAAAEILVKSYVNSFFSDGAREINVATARAGNVIGGGDWALDRLIPDIFRAIKSCETLELRNPQAVRPWQHVLDPLTGYMLLAEKLYENNGDYRGSWNFGPDYKQTKTVAEIIKFIEKQLEITINIGSEQTAHYKETTFLKLDSTKSNSKLNWHPTWDLERTLEKTVDWYSSVNSDQNAFEFTKSQIEGYIQDLFRTLS